jgi:hypothetical protein
LGSNPNVRERRDDTTAIDLVIQEEIVWSALQRQVKIEQCTPFTGWARHRTHIVWLAGAERDRRGGICRLREPVFSQFTHME